MRHISEPIEEIMKSVSTPRVRDSRPEPLMFGGFWIAVASGGRFRKVRIGDTTLPLKQALRLRAWLDEAIVWLEGEGE